MNRKLEDLIAEYKNADFNKRLHIYLQYPELRSDFILIDLDELNRDEHHFFPQAS